MTVNNEKSPNSIEFYKDRPTKWKHQAAAILNQAGAVQNTWYPVLAATNRYTRIMALTFVITVANETLEVEITVDGRAIVCTMAAVFGTIYQPYWVSAAADTLGGIAVASTGFTITGHNISVRARKTTATGAGALQARVEYAVM